MDLEQVLQTLVLENHGFLRARGFAHYNNHVVHYVCLGNELGALCMLSTYFITKLSAQLDLTLIFDLKSFEKSSIIF